MRDRFVRQKGVWLETAVFLILFALALGSMTHMSPTFDEQGFIARGLGYLRGENKHMRVGHPLGLNGLNTSLLVSDETVVLPNHDPSWALPNFHRPSELFLWEIGNDVTHVMFLARLPTIWLGLLLTAFVGRWVWEITRARWAVWLALGLVAFDPNLLAHMRLATTDYGLTTFAFLAGYLLWRFGKRPSWARAVLAGIGFGLLQNTKFTAGLFLPLFAIAISLFLLSWFRQSFRETPLLSRYSPLAMLLFAYPAAAFLTLWAAYGFQVGEMPANLPTLPQLSGATLPLSHHWEQLLDIGGRLQKSTPAFLAGAYSESGWWYYFPIAFLLKTPLPTLILLLLALLGLIWLAAKKELSERWLTLFSLLIPAVGYFAFSLTTDINLGYRHILPIFPFLIGFIAVVLNWLVDSLPVPNNISSVVLVGLVGWLVGSALWLYPNYLAFFNPIAGGPEGGWRYLVDSNLDWGQELKNLKTWIDNKGVERVWLSYFGEGRPSYYNINFTGLDSFPPRLMNPQARPFYPHDPAPGVYAISATTLQGVHFANHDTFAWFRDKTPLDKIGYSIFLYEVPSHGNQVDILLAGVQLDEIDLDDFVHFQSNQIVPRWIDISQAFLWPTATDFWLVMSKDSPGVWEELPVSLNRVAENERYSLYQVHTAIEKPQEGTAFKQGADEITWLGGLNEPRIDNGNLHLATMWRKVDGVPPVKIYLHMLDDLGQIVAQWDGLSVAWEGWRVDDLLWQRHVIELPNNLSGRYQLRVGLYHPETAVRWQTADGRDFIELGAVEVSP